jgi:hypothetical protein
MKPKLLYDVLRQTSPRKMYGSLAVPTNRYNVLSRDNSPADSVRSNLSQRSRSVSIKRKNSSSGTGTDNPPISYANVTAVSGSVNVQNAAVENLTEDIVKVKSVCDKLGTMVNNSDVSPGLIEIFSVVKEAFSGICDNQGKIVELLKNNQQQPPNVPVLEGPTLLPSNGNSGKRFKPASNKPTTVPQPSMVDLATLVNKNISGNSKEDATLRNFKESVKEAEKSTLVFNLNMGRVPIMNQETMSTKATMALNEMATKVAKAEGKTTNEDTLSAIDYVLSVVEGMTFYGKKTKSYSKKGDPDSGSYCTVPVRYDFRDRDIRSYAETVLRDKCKIQCATPYPLILRETIKQVINGVKKEFPNCYVRVVVDTGKMCLRVFRRPKLDPGSTAEKEWFKMDDPVPIPAEALDIYAKEVPEGFKVVHQFRKNRTSRGSDSSVMEDDMSQVSESRLSCSQPNVQPQGKKSSPGKTA